MSHSHKDELYVGPYRLEKTLGKGQTGKQTVCEVNPLHYTCSQLLVC